MVKFTDWGSEFLLDSLGKLYIQAMEVRADDLDSAEHNSFVVVAQLWHDLVDDPITN